MAKTTFFAEKDAKTGHKNTSNMADKHPHTPVKVSSGFASCF